MTMEFEMNETRTSVSSDLSETSLQSGFSEEPIVPDMVQIAETKLATEDIDTTIPEGELFIAAAEGDLKTVQKLLSEGVSPVEYTNDDLENALHAASKEGQVKVANELIEVAKDEELDAKNTHEWTPLHQASYKGHNQIVNALIEAGANVGAITNTKCTPLHLASQEGHVDIMQALIRAGADVDACAEMNYTSLHLASQYGHSKAVDVLLKSNANYDAYTLDGYGAVHLAAREGHPNCLRLLVRHGADISDKAMNYNTPLHLAAYRGHLETVKVIIEELGGVNDVHDRGWKFRTPKEKAKMEGHKQVADYLRAVEKGDGTLSSIRAMISQTSDKSSTGIGFYLPPASPVQKTAPTPTHTSSSSHKSPTSPTPTTTSATLRSSSEAAPSSPLQKSSSPLTLVQKSPDPPTPITTTQKSPSPPVSPSSPPPVPPTYSASQGQKSGLFKKIPTPPGILLFHKKSSTTTPTSTVQKSPMEQKEFVTPTAKDAKVSSNGSTKKGILSFIQKDKSKESKEQKEHKEGKENKEHHKKPKTEEAVAPPRVFYKQDIFDCKLGNYIVNFYRPVGRGIWGDVLKAKKVAGKNVVALKRITWNGDPSGSAQAEIKVLQSVAINKYIHPILDFDVVQDMLIVVSDICPLGDLNKYFRSKTVAATDKYKLMNQAALGLNHLHSHAPAIIHCKIKPQNILITQGGEGSEVILKLADFGFSKIIEKYATSSFSDDSFLAPELLAFDCAKDYTKEADIFSLGLVFLAMLQHKSQGQLNPVIEGREWAGIPISREMMIANHTGQPIPAVIAVKDEDDYMMSKVKSVLKEMTRFLPNDRIIMSRILKEMTSTKDI